MSNHTIDLRLEEKSRSCQAGNAEVWHPNLYGFVVHYCILHCIVSLLQFLFVFLLCFYCFYCTVHFVMSSLRHPPAAWPAVRFGKTLNNDAAMLFGLTSATLKLSTRPNFKRELGITSLSESDPVGHYDYVIKSTMQKYHAFEVMRATRKDASLHVHAAP